MKLHATLVGIVWVAAAATVQGAQFTAPHTPPSTTFVTVSGGNACPKGTTELYSGSSVVFRNTGNGNLTEDTRCWKNAPTSTADVDVVVLGPCVVCRFGR